MVQRDNWGLRASVMSRVSDLGLRVSKMRFRGPNEGPNDKIWRHKIVHLSLSVCLNHKCVPKPLLHFTATVFPCNTSALIGMRHVGAHLMS